MNNIRDNNRFYCALRLVTKRHQSAQTKLNTVLAGLGAFIAIYALFQIASWSGSPLLMAPFGATCVLVFALPESPLSQPINVVGGHLVSTAIGLCVHAYFPVTGWALALAVGLAVVGMTILRVTHPPAGADPLVVYFDAPGVAYLAFPVASGSVVLVAFAVLYHRLCSRRIYPI